MGFIKITKAALGFQASVNQFVTIKYKLTSLPDIESNYIIDATGVVVLPNGNLASPYYINNLLDFTSYTVHIQNECGGTGYKQVFTTGGAPQTTHLTTAPATTHAPTTQTPTTPAPTTLPPTTLPPTTPAPTTPAPTTLPPTTEAPTTPPPTTLPPTTPAPTTVPPTTVGGPNCAGIVAENTQPSQQQGSSNIFGVKVTLDQLYNEDIVVSGHMVNQLDNNDVYGDFMVTVQAGQLVGNDNDNGLYPFTTGPTTTLVPVIDSITPDSVTGQADSLTYSTQCGLNNS